MTESEESSAHTRPLTILFIPCACYGPMNQCIGMGDILHRRGHYVVIITDPSWRGKLASMGLQEYIIDTGNPANKDAEQRPGEYWTNYVRDALPKFRQSPYVQVGTYVRPTWHAMLEEAKLYDQHLRSAITFE